ncbi:MAG: DUF3794 domain-containing protein [Ruminococcus sp.]|nr:DUF3794 domain-containing protein [Ruminococcus sp.]
MEYKLNKHTVYAAQYALDSVTEQSVDADVILPDYCPDIERILRCSLSPCVYARSLSGGELSVEGEAAIHILYIDSNKKHIRSFEYQTPWSAAIPLKTPAEHCAVFLRCKTEYINCRALSPRKLSFHGAFSLYAKALCRQPIDFYHYDGDDDLETKTDTIEVSSLCGLCEDRFSYTEDIPLSDRPYVESILSSRVKVKMTDSKLMTNKLMLTAQGELEMMYLSDPDKETPERLSYSFPISRLIDCEGLEEDTVCDVDLSVQSYDLSSSRDALSDGSLLTLDLKLCACITGYRQERVDAVVDAYSTDGVVEMTKTPITMPDSVSVEQFTRVEKYTLNVENEKIGEVLDIGVDSASASVVAGDESPKIQTKLKLCLLLKNPDGEPFYLERSPEFTFSPDIALKERTERVCVRADSVSYRIVDDQHIELRIELSYLIVTAEILRCSPVSAVQRSDSSEREPDDSSLILYFADKGESLWDISKNYATRLCDLKEENAVEEDTLPEPMMLLIPTPN